MQRYEPAAPRAVLGLVAVAVAVAMAAIAIGAFAVLPAVFDSLEGDRSALESRT